MRYTSLFTIHGFKYDERATESIQSVKAERYTIIIIKCSKSSFSPSDAISRAFFLIQSSEWSFNTKINAKTAKTANGIAESRAPVPQYKQAQIDIKSALAHTMILNITLNPLKKPTIKPPKIKKCTNRSQCTKNANPNCRETN